MTAILKSSLLLTAEEYLEGERYSEVRHEFVDGYVYAMAGASDDHNRISGNVFCELRDRLRGKRCEAFINDMKVMIPPEIAEAYYYPDVLVTCDPKDNAGYFREKPTVIFEVLSTETERTDRHEKAMAYWVMASLKTYVLVDQSRVLITVLRRSPEGWQTQLLNDLAATLDLPEIEASIPLTRIYERTAVASPQS